MVTSDLERIERARKARRLRYEKNRDKIVAAQTARRRANPEKAAAARKAYYEANKEKVTASNKEWRKNNKARVAELNNFHHFHKRKPKRQEQARLKRIAKLKNRIPRVRLRDKDKEAAYYAMNIEHIKNRARLWSKENAAARAASTALRKAQRRRATPLWVNRTDLRSVYRSCVRITAQTGVRHHVDHIIPIKSKVVCGLHVPWNLQVIPWIENVKKGNKLLNVYLAGPDQRPAPRHRAVQLLLL